MPRTQYEVAIDVDLRLPQSSHCAGLDHWWDELHHSSRIAHFAET